MTSFVAKALARALFPILLLGAVPAHAAVSGTSPSGNERTHASPSAEEIRLGERMYREGILPSGEPMKAITMGDIRVDGRMFTCVSCHQRSGMGSLEGTVYTTAVYGAKLYAPLSKFDRTNKSMLQKNLPIWSGDQLIRTAYTDETLGRAIRTGVNADGKPFDPVMPKYELSDADMAIMIAYLKHLSDAPQPGVSMTMLRFATVVSEDVPKKRRDAMLVPLQTVMNTWSRLRPTVMRPIRKGSYIEDETKKSFRKVTLDVWELKGPRETWRQQLDAYQAKSPAFALVGGMVTGSWEPIHRFCEDRRMPSLLPLTDLPVIAEKDWYTLYFSEGYSQEGDSAALFLKQRFEDKAPALGVTQIIRNSAAAEALAQGFRDAWRRFGYPAPEEVRLGAGEPLPEAAGEKIGTKQTVLLLWDADAVPALERMTSSPERPTMIFLSSRLCGTSYLRVPETLRSSVYLTYPRTLPEDAARWRGNIELWLKQNRIPAGDLDIETQMSTLLSMLSNAISMMSMRNYYNRDFFFELMDMMRDDMMNKALYPSLSFGPGQRYAAKGCYIVQLSSGASPTIVPKSGWVIH